MSKRVEKVEKAAWELVIQLEWALKCLDSLNSIARTTETLPYGATAITESAIESARQRLNKAKEVLGNE